MEFARALYTLIGRDAAAAAAAAPVVARPPRAGLSERDRRTLRPLSMPAFGRRVFWVHAVSRRRDAGRAAAGRTAAAHLPRGNDPAHAHDRDRPRSGPRTLRRRASCRRGFPTTFRSRSTASSRTFGRAAGSLMETELWPNLIAQCARARDVPVFLVNARLSERSAARLRAVRGADAADAARACAASRRSRAPMPRVSPRSARRTPSSPATSSSTSLSPTTRSTLGAELAQRFGASRPVWLAASHARRRGSAHPRCAGARAAARWHAAGHRAAASAALCGRRAICCAQRGVPFVRRSDNAAGARRRRASCSAIRWARCSAITRRPTWLLSAAACCRSAGRT